MKPALTAAVLLLTAAAGLDRPAHAQAALVAPETTGAIQGSIALSPAQEAELRLHAAREGARPAAVRDPVAVGVALPAGVELQPIPQTVIADMPAARGYRYVATDAGLAIVNPETRRVVRLIEAP
jgi:hypothetical protein